MAPSEDFEAIFGLKRNGRAAEGMAGDRSVVVGNGNGIVGDLLERY